MTTGKAGGSKVGKFGIGVRVVDDEGDVGVIVGKRKGEREIDYDRYGKMWWHKGLLAVAANDNAAGVEAAGELLLEAGNFYRTRDGRKVVVEVNGNGDTMYPWFHDNGCGSFHGLTAEGKSCIGTDEDDLIAEWSDSTTDTPSISPEIVVNDYSGAAGGENSSEWVPKVGDRVDDPAGGGMATVSEVRADGKFTVTWDSGCVGEIHWRTDAWTFVSRPLPVAEQPAAEVTDERADAGGGFKAGDRIRLIDGDIDSMPLGSEFVAIARTLGLSSSVHFMDGDGDETWRPGAYFELVTPLTIEAGKSYRTRDGRKVGPILKREYASGSPYQWVGEASNGYRLIFKDDGENYEGRGSIHDLVAEWVEPAAEDLEVAEAEVEALLAEPTSPAKFKVGDRVKIARNTRGDAHLNEAVGGEFTITTADGIAGKKGWSGFSSESPYWWPEADLELAPTPTFARNDLVTLAAPVKVTGTSADRVHISFPNGGSFTLPASALIAA